MNSLTYMTLKVLYTLDDGRNNNYLARSSQPVQVQVATIPMPCISHSNNNTGVNQSNANNSNVMKIGAVKLSHVLREIRSSSPELLLLLLSSSTSSSLQNTKGANDQDGDIGQSTLKYYDYNVYYRDVCEEDEPLVSLGLLSKIRADEEEQEQEQVSDNDNDDQPLVVGRVCTNFSALVTTQNRKLQNFSSINSPTETLEVKIRFSKVPVVPRDHTPSNTKNGNSKRKTNGNPAPRAERTLSLPVWNANVTKSNLTNQELFTTSIAHKIYLADRQDGKSHDVAPNTNMGDISPSVSAQFHYKHQQIIGTPMPYREGNQLARHKLRADQDDISKRFEFMLNKKKPAIAGTRTKQDGLKKSKKKVVKPSKSKNKNKDKTKNRDKSSNIGNENPVPLPPLPLPSANSTDILKITPGTNNIQSPSQANNPSLKPIDNNSAVTPVWFHNSAAVTNIDISSGTTPNDIPTIEDPDRTSPIDTLSMPLMEFEQQQQQQEGTPNGVTNLPEVNRSNSLIPQEQNSKKGQSLAGRKKLVSCQEQLRRIPLLSQRKQSVPVSACSSTVTGLGIATILPDASLSDYVRMAEAGARAADMDIDTEALDLKLDDIDEIPSIFDIGTFPVDFSLDDVDDGGDCGNGDNVPHSTCVSEFDAPDTVPNANDALVTGLIMGKNEVSTFEGNVGEENIRDEELELELELEEEEEVERQKRRAMPSSPSMMHTYSALHDNASIEMGENGTPKTKTTTTVAAADVVTIDINNEDEDENDSPVEDGSEANVNANTDVDANNLFSFTPVSKRSSGIGSSGSDIMDSDLRGQETPATTVRYSSSDPLDSKK